MKKMLSIALLSVLVLTAFAIPVAAYDHYVTSVHSWQESTLFNDTASLNLSGISTPTGAYDYDIAAIVYHDDNQQGTSYGVHVIRYGSIKTSLSTSNSAWLTNGSAYTCYIIKDTKQIAYAASFNASNSISVNNSI